MRNAVAAGLYRPGDLIPSVRAQAMALLVNPNTVQRAYELLEREGLIVGKKGTGMIVAANSKSTAKNGAEGSIRTSFTQTIAAGSSAGLSRPAVDKIYRDAWNDLPKDAAKGERT